MYYFMVIATHQQKQLVRAECLNATHAKIKLRILFIFKLKLSNSGFIFFSSFLKSFELNLLRKILTLCSSGHISLNLDKNYFSGQKHLFVSVLPYMSQDSFHLYIAYVVDGDVAANWPAWGKHSQN